MPSPVRHAARSCGTAGAKTRIYHWRPKQDDDGQAEQDTEDEI